MGMMSYAYGDLEVTDEKGMREWLDNAQERAESLFSNKKFEKGYESKENLIQNYVYWAGEFKNALNNKLDLAEVFDEHKIVGYWYGAFCAFIRDLAMYVEGEVELEYEVRNEGDARLIFSEGFVEVTFSETTWTKPELLEVATGLPELPDDEKLLRGI